MPHIASRNVEFFSHFGDGRLPEHMGLRFTHVSEGLLRAEFTIAPHHFAPNGYLHAASIIALADTAAGYACYAHLPEGSTSFTTIELKCNFVGAAKEGVVSCEARAVHLGNATQLWDVEVKREGSDKPIALFRCTQMVLWPKT
jgi:1,4-dihydroxy-2-naphthoyl-CoA hydrolase